MTAEEFLAAYEEIVAKYGYFIWSCGCCDERILKVSEELIYDRDGHLEELRDTVSHADEGDRASGDD